MTSITCRCFWRTPLLIAEMDIIILYDFKLHRDIYYWL